MNITLHISSSNILRRRNQAIITVFITAIAVFITLLISSVLFQVKEGIKLSLDRVGADVMIIANTNDFEDTSLLYSGKPLRRYIKREDIGFLDELDSQIEAKTEQFFTHTLTGGCCSVNEKLRVVGIDSSTDFIIKPWLEQNGLNGLSKHTAIVGSNVIYPLGDRMVLLGQPFDVVGTLYQTGTGMDVTIFMPIDMARSLEREKFPPSVFWDRDPDDLISSVFIKLKQGVDPSSFANMINDSQFKVIAAAKFDTMNKLEDSIRGWVQVVLFLTGSIIIITCLSLFGRFTALMKERKKEIGYLLSLGYSSAKIFWISILEIGMMSVAGGVIASLSVLFSLNAVLKYVSVQFTLPRSSLSLEFMLIVFVAGPVLALVLGLLSSLAPALKIAGLEPKDVMTRGEV